jgi:protein TonB
MKRIILLIILTARFLSILSQEKTKPEEAFYLLDENYKAVTAEKAKFLVHSVKENDSSWLFDTYNIYGPLVSSEHYNNGKASVLQGEAIYFNKKGNVDSSGEYLNGLQNGKWSYINAKGKLAFEKNYVNGTPAGVKDFAKPDSANNKKEVLVKQMDEIESDFPGGVNGWLYYLNKKLVYPERAQNLQKQGQVIIQFIVDTEGHIISPEIVQSVEYSLDQEAMRMIKESPNWTPAFQNGKKVKSYKKQPITFRLTAN